MFLLEALIVFPIKEGLVIFLIKAVVEIQRLFK